MIEIKKLEGEILSEQSNENSSSKIVTVPDTYEIIEKINELISVVNEQQKMIKFIMDIGICDFKDENPITIKQLWEERNK